MFLSGDYKVFPVLFFLGKAQAGSLGCVKLCTTAQQPACLCWQRGRAPWPCEELQELLLLAKPADHGV